MRRAGKPKSPSRVQPPRLQAAQSAAGRRPHFLHVARKCRHSSCALAAACYRAVPACMAAPTRAQLPPAGEPAALPGTCCAAVACSSARHTTWACQVPGDPLLPAWRRQITSCVDNWRTKQDHAVMSTTPGRPRSRPPHVHCDAPGPHASLALRIARQGVGVSEEHGGRLAVDEPRPRRWCVLLAGMWRNSAHLTPGRATHLCLRRRLPQRPDCW